MLSVAVLCVCAVALGRVSARSDSGNFLDDKWLTGRWDKFRDELSGISKKQAGKKLLQYLPSCDEEGYYRPHQCHSSSGQCWCADRFGNEVAGSRTHGPADCFDVGASPICKDPLGWMFSRLDTNFDLQLDQSEIKSLYLDRNEPCSDAFFKSCDTHPDKVITSSEWCTGFQRLDPAKDPCLKIKCSRHKVCVAEDYKTASCVSQRRVSFKDANLHPSAGLKCKPCPVVHPSPVCGSDGHTYSTK
uniref:SPARC (osteonectin), cwcv and kazal like domains proteoglycan 3 n=1 Tax=Fundulus heteroclitus TaxID=8078 RepID=A0A3Q2U630_FUNHE